MANKSSDNPAPALSVILPNFNHAQYVGRALDAMLAQELPPDEILVIDDASNDSSLAVLTDYAAKHPRIRLIANTENRGAVRVLQQGIDAARGAYIYLAAADDWIMPGFFKRALEMLERDREAGLFCGDAVMVDGVTMQIKGHRPAVRPLRRAGIVRPVDALRMLKQIDNWILTSSAVFRRSALVDAGGLDAEMGSFADGHVARKLALTRGFCYAPEVASTVCIFATSFSQRTALDIDRALAAGEMMSRKIAGDPAFPPWYPDLFRRRWHFAAARLAIEAQPPGRELLLGMGARRPSDKPMLESLLRLPRRFARLAVLGWLWFRWRPYRLTSLAATALQRKMER